MAIGGPFRALGGFLDACERGERVVHAVDVIDDIDTDTDPGLAADVKLSCELPRTEQAGNGVAWCSPRLGPDGTVRFALEHTRELVPHEEFDVEVELTEATVEAEGRVTVSLRVRPAADSDTEDIGTLPSISGSTTNRENDGDDRVTDSHSDADRPVDHGREATVDQELPPFKNPELLADVYHSNDTFAEMADAIDMDVTAETVRRYMIDFEIHQPNSYETGGVTEPDVGGTTEADAAEAAGEMAQTEKVEAPSDESRRGGKRDGVPTEVPASAADTDAEVPDQVVLSDGIGLPEDVTAEKLIETVKRSNTIYEVTQDIGLEQQEAFEMLHDLDLVDLVMGRLATEVERDITRDDIVERLREASATQ